MSNETTQLADRYGRAAPRWRDKMRVLGYFDGYLGFLGMPGFRGSASARVNDVGCGTGAFAEAWVTIHGAPRALTLLDPSRAMLDTAALAIGAHGVTPDLTEGLLGSDMPPADEVLAAHVLEHCPDPAAGLAQMRDMLHPDGRLRLVVSKPHWCNSIIWLQWRHRTFGRDEIQGLLHQTGFRIDAQYAFPAGPPSRTSMGIVASAT